MADHQKIDCIFKDLVATGEDKAHASAMGTQDRTSQNW